ncbi:helix-turn-helix domain-containing protein [Paenibacillus alkaliterrae]|uniref:helix-turn-helix domain-containing protein n=1 Tax=Paenibacillus alkaliterrae TaxID=320909 RepID=UPI001F2F18D1|nr:helix-turn-helix domain-containing protein [Paenibacillus alkaliterrae]MCF2937203.1 helix-turn-helix domain-containing protein [Paenibacillus alkaliterrae]
MNRTWLRKMIWSYIPIFFIIFSFVFFMFFQTLVEQNNKNTRESSKVFARQLLQSVDVSLKSVNAVILREILNNKLFMDFFNEKDDGNIYLNYQVAKRLSALKQEVPLIDSYYLVRYSDQLIYNGNVINSLPDFEDAPFVREVQRRSDKSPWSDLRTYREFAFQNKKDVVSLVHKVPLSIGSDGLFVVNISISALQDMVADMYDPATTFVNLYDRNGHSLFKRGESVKEREPLASVSSPYTGWKAESGVYNGRIVSAVSTFSSVWLMLGFLVLIAGVVSIIYVTRKNYKPIEDIVFQINDKLFQDKHTLGRLPVDEFAFIESAINNFTEQSKAFKKEYEEAVLHKKKTFFTELIAGDGNVSDFTNHLPIPAHERLKVLIIEIDNAEQSFCSYQTRDQSLFKFVLSSVTHELASQHAINVWLEWTSHLQLTGIFFLDGPETEMTDICEGIVAWVNKNLKFTLTIGIGEPAVSLKGAADSYKEALESLKFKAVMGNNRLINYREARNATSKETNKHLKAIDSLVQTFRLSEEGWHHCFRQWFDGMRKCRLSKNEIIELGRYFIAHMDLHLSQVSKDHYEIWTCHALNPAQKMIGEFDTLDELQQSFSRILEGFSGRLTVLCKGRQYHRLMKEIREYIEQHFANPELSLDYLSDKFSINAKYLSQLFKEEFGENFLDFLADVRIQHAKKWLVEQQDSIQDVGERVGYVNAATFRRVFRRVEGLSPVDYRKLNAIENTG